MVVAAEAAIDAYSASPLAGELNQYERILSGRLGSLHESDVRSTGYVVHTLEASLWCLLKAESFEEAVLKAVNLGGDTDTVGAVTGGLAGLLYGLPAVPRDWIVVLARRDELENQFKKFLTSPRLS